VALIGQLKIKYLLIIRLFKKYKNEIKTKLDIFMTEKAFSKKKITIPKEYVIFNVKMMHN